MAKVVLPPDPNWPHAFAEEAVRLRELLTPLALHHVGSTAVPGLMAKPVIDVLVEVGDLSAADARTAAMTAAGYEARGAYGIEGRRYFKRPAAGSRLAVHVHVYQQGSPHIERHLRFRDYLLIRPDLVDAYSALKRSLCDAGGAAHPHYVQGKASFVQDVERAAMAHFRKL